MFVALGRRDTEPALAAARSIDGRALVAVEGQRDPVFTTLVVGSDRAAIDAVADLGLYAVTVRPMRHQRRFWPSGTVSPGVTAVYAMVRRSDLTHEAADAHWRDDHAPLALRHHPGMWHYHQISVDRIFHGPAYDGFALCAFASQQEMSERFFGGSEDQAVIAADVAKFSDLVHSPRRVRMLEWRFGLD